MTDLGMPDTRSTHSDDISVADQTIGHGQFDIVIVTGSIIQIEFNRELLRFAVSWTVYPFARAVTFNKRAQGLSDALRVRLRQTTAFRKFARRT
jgi:hypothetical protein